MARTVRGEVLSLKEREFVVAARALGAGAARVLLRHLLRNTVHLIVVRATLDIGPIILTEATLSFLGLGVQRPMPSWGVLIADSFQYLQSAPALARHPVHRAVGDHPGAELRRRGAGRRRWTGRGQGILTPRVDWADPDLDAGRSRFDPKPMHRAEEQMPRHRLMLPIVLSVAVALLAAAPAGTQAPITFSLRAAGRAAAHRSPSGWPTSAPYTVTSQIYSTLTILDEKLQIVPYAAEKWTVSPDGLTWTFKLPQQPRVPQRAQGRRQRRQVFAEPAGLARFRARRAPSCCCPTSWVSRR